MKHKWNFVKLGGTTLVHIHNGEDIRHLPELDQKLWTVLSCPTSGLEIDEQSLKIMDLDNDGKLRVDEVVAASQWLCSVLRDPQVLIAKSDTLALTDIADETLLALAKEVAGDKDKVSLADVDAAIAAAPGTVQLQEVPAAPLDADVMAAYHAKHDEYVAYYELERLAKLGLAVIPEDAVKPGMTKAKFDEMGAKISEFEAATAAANDANAAATAAAVAKYEPLRKLLLLSRDFYHLLRNYVAFEDFYDREPGVLSSFQVGTLYIDRRACALCLRVNDMAKHAAEAEKSGMYLVYCACESKKLAKTMTVVAAVTVGDIHNLYVGKNAIFYDNAGNDWDATVVKIIDNPISISQAFWTPYRKFANWVVDLVNKSAAEKDAKAFSDVTGKVQDNVSGTGDAAAKTPQAFDIAKFAGIFAAIGMAVGYIGAFFTSLFTGIAALTWWQLIASIIGIMLVISGPSMIIAWLKLRRRNYGPVLNANGWAINANAIISVPFGLTLTSEVKVPVVKFDPYAKKGWPAWVRWTISIATVAVIVVVLWLFGLLNWCGLNSPISRFAKQEVVEEVVTDAAPADTVAVAAPAEDAQ